MTSSGALGTKSRSDRFRHFVPDEVGRGGTKSSRTRADIRVEHHLIVMTRTTLQIRCRSRDELEEWKLGAERAGVTLTDIVRAGIARELEWLAENPPATSRPVGDFEAELARLGFDV